MATNLRLPDELASALRAAAARSGRSQQDIVRTAIARELGLSPDETEAQRAVRIGLVDPPVPLRDDEPTLRLPAGTSSLTLLDREDR